MWGWKGSKAVLAALAALTLLAATAQARPGFYVGIGLAQQSVSGDMDGTHAYNDPVGSPLFGDGKLDSGSPGLTAQIGYGLNNYWAVEYLYAKTAHGSKNTEVDESSDAQFTSQLFGVRLSLPMGKRAEFFFRGGYGIYDINFDDMCRVTPASQTSCSVNFHGTGTALGAGLEVMFNELGIGFGFTQHAFKLDRAKPSGERELGLSNELDTKATTADVMFTWHW